MRYLHTMIRVLDVDATLAFFCEGLELVLTRRNDYEKGRFSLLFLSTGTPGDTGELELTWNWDQETPYEGGRNFGHLAYEVDDIYACCARLQALGVEILRPPRNGHMAFVRSPDQISVELLQKGAALTPAEPWASMANTGSW